MNLIDFEVTKIISEEYGRLWELFEMTESELEIERDNTSWEWYQYLLGNAVKQKYQYVDDGGFGERQEFFNLDYGQKPYYVGYIGQH